MTDNNNNKKFEREAHGIKIYSGNANLPLATAICQQLGLKLSEASVSQFSNGEISVLIKESVRGEDVYIIQPTCNPHVNDYIMELLIMVDAMKRGSAKRITAVVPHYAYARQDRKDKSRAPISSKLVANMFQTSGIDRVITMDLHASQIQGFFDIPVDNLYAEPLLVKWVQDNIKGDKVIVSPDVGGVKRAKTLADILNVDLAIIHKERKKANEVSEMILVGEVKGKIAVLVDDMADTCGTLKLAADTLIAKGATEVYALVTHAVLSGKAVQILNDSKLTKLIVTDTIPHEEKKKQTNKLETITVAPMLAEAIRRTHAGSSISYLFDNHKQ